MMDLAFIEKLLDLLSRSEAETIEIRKWTTTIRVSKNSGATVSGAAGSQVIAAASAAPAHPPLPYPPGPEGGGGAEQPTAAPAPAPPIELIDIKSPMVGTFYTQPEPGAEPYVRVGSRIDVGQTLCVIEAMKIMNPLDAEISGLIKEVSVQDAQPVEFGQVLFRVDPNG